MKPPFSQTAAAPFFCWDIHLLTVQGRKAVLAMNRASRYSILLYGMNGADWKRLPDMIQSEICCCRVVCAVLSWAPFIRRWLV